MFVNKRTVLVIVIVTLVFFSGYGASLLVNQTISSSVNVVVRFGDGPVRAYWDAARSQLVSSIDFGDVRQGDSSFVNFYVFNEDPELDAVADWSSNIIQATNGSITDQLTADGFSLRGREIAPNGVVYATYMIIVGFSTPPRRYDWTLNIGVMVSNQSPTASFTFSPTKPDVGQLVFFDGRASSDPDGTITHYSWTFGDGITGTGATIYHSYSGASTFTVTLTVIDNNGAPASTTRTVSVNQVGENLIVRDGWSIPWELSPSDGIALVNVTFNGAPIVRDARLPGILVTYIGSSCFFYDELMAGWIGEVFVEDSPLGGFQLRADYDVPGYDYEQIWRFLPDGTFMGLLVVGGGGCFAFHTYESRWRYDFGLGGNNTLRVFDGTNWNVVEQEAELRDSGSRDPSRKDTVWEISGSTGSYSFAPVDIPEEPAQPGTSLAVASRTGEIENSHNPATVTPYVYLNGESLTSQDTSLFYISQHSHNVSEGIVFEAPVYTGLVFYPTSLALSTFSLTATPSFLKLLPGNSTSTTVTLSSLGGFSGEVSMATSVDPVRSGGLYVTGIPSFVSLLADETLTFTLFVYTNTTADPGLSTVTVTGTSGLVHRWAYVAVEVQAVAPPPPPPPPPSTYTRTLLPQQFVTGGSPQNLHADDATVKISLPFTFIFYGRPFTSLWASTNGLITFTGGDATYSNSIEGLRAKFAIAPLWDDWLTHIRAGDDIYAGPVDADHFLIRWQAVAIYNTSIFVNFEVILGRNGTILFNYGSNNGSISATLGISDGAGDSIAEDTISSNLRNSILFTPGGTGGPIATFAYSPGKPNVGEQVFFDGSASFDPNGTIVLYVWQFGDGANATAPIAYHTYFAPGTYLVTLTVTDDEGASDSDSRIVVVNALGIVVSVNPSSVGPVSVGSTFDILVRVDGVEGMVAYAGTLFYDTTILTALAADAEAAETICSVGCEDITPENINDALGEVNWEVAMIGVPSGFTGSGAMVKITFVVDAVGDSQLRPQTVLLDTTFSEIPHQDVSGFYNGTAYLPGVQVGDWARYSVIGNLTGTADIQAALLNVTRVSGTNVTLVFTIFYINGTSTTQEVFQDVAAPSLGFFLFAANLTTGDPLWPGSPYVVNSTITGTFAGAQREANVFEVSFETDSTTVTFDQLTGFLLEYELLTTTGDYRQFLRVSIIETNSW